MPSAAKELPVEYAAGRFFVCPVTKDQNRLRLFTDTGGADFLRQSAVARLNLETTTVSAGEKDYEIVSFPEFASSAWIPSISESDDPRASALRGSLVVYSDEAGHHDGDGTLGQARFARSCMRPRRHVRST